MDTVLGHKDRIDEAIHSLNSALQDAHGEGFAVYLHASSTDHCIIETMGQPASYIREPAQVALMDVAEFMGGEGVTG